MNVQRTWRMTAWQAVLAAVWVATVAACAYFASSMREFNVLMEAKHRAAIVNSAMLDDQRMQDEKKPLTVAAQTLVRTVTASRDYNAAVIDDSGKLVAGYKSLVLGVMLPQFGFPPRGEAFFGTAGSKLGEVGFGPGGPFAGPMPAAGAQIIVQNRRGSDHVREVPPGAMLAPPMGVSTFFRESFVPGTDSSTVARIYGGWLIFDRKPELLGNLGSWYWPAAAVITLLSFVSVWSVGRRTLAQTVYPMARVERGLRRLLDSGNSQVEALSADDAGLAAPLIESYNAAAVELASILRRRTEVEAGIRQFVADAGHELRTPLAVIMGYVQLLRGGAATSESVAGRIFSEIEDQGQRMTMLIQKLLLLTKMDSQDPRDVRLVDASQIAANVVESFRAIAGTSKLAVHTEPGAFVTISESELREIIANLLDNAVKYAPGSTIETSVQKRDDAIIIRVADNGPGMSPETRARAFERFSRGETAGSIAGSGLGLSIVERAAERAGGSITLDAALGRGTSVEIRIPSAR